MEHRGYFHTLSTTFIRFHLLLLHPSFNHYFYTFLEHYLYLFLDNFSFFYTFFETLFIGPRYTWGPFYGSESLKLSDLVDASYPSYPSYASYAS